MTKRVWVGIGIALFIILLAAGSVWFWYGRLPSSAPGAGDERFGFLAGPDPQHYRAAAERGAEFVRPHPGAFIWGEIQTSPEGEFDFSDTDQEVQLAQKNNLRILATLWPWAKWDQENRADRDSCRVEDEFSFTLGPYRCNPANWESYASWVAAVVERYDGDGEADMPGLANPIQHWEVLNEPDLQPPPEMAGGLQFYKQTPRDYGELLKNTYRAIKSADPQTLVLIAGAAGGNEQFLDFYRELFADLTIKDYFDIANVHCISNDDWGSFNVSPYKVLLEEFGLDKPIWVTEAEAFVSSDADIVATQVKLSTQKALELGAEKIFYTAPDFRTKPGQGQVRDEQNLPKPDPSLDGSAPIETYRKIFQAL